MDGYGYGWMDGWIAGLNYGGSAKSDEGSVFVAWEEAQALSAEGLGHPSMCYPDSGSGPKEAHPQAQIWPDMHNMPSAHNCPVSAGKTITLKTTGLAVLMAKAGLYVAVDAAASGAAPVPVRMLWYDQVLADIGDAQSLQQVGASECVKGPKHCVVLQAVRMHKGCCVCVGISNTGFYCRHGFMGS